MIIIEFSQVIGRLAYLDHLANLLRDERLQLERIPQRRHTTVPLGGRHVQLIITINN